MAKIVITNPSITINSVDLKDHIAQVTINTSVNEIQTTAFGSTGVTRAAGLLDSSIQLSFMQDYAASNVEQTIYPLIGTTTTIVVKPVTGTTTSTNPAYSMSVLVTEWSPINGAVGELVTADVTWPVDGLITKSTA